MKTQLKNIKNAAGFTLLEVLLGAVIFAIISTLTYGALFGTLKTQRTMDEKTLIQETGTTLINKIREDLIQVFHVDSLRPLTFFKGEDKQNNDTLSFTCLSHFPSRYGAKESEQTTVTYELEKNPEQSELFLLKRRETPFISSTDKDNQTQGDFVVISKNVTLFNLQYHDGEKYIQSWDIRSPQNLNKLPKMVWVQFNLKDDKGREREFGTVVEIPMSENLGETQSNPTQNPNPNAPPQPNAPNPSVPSTPGGP